MCTISPSDLASVEEAVNGLLEPIRVFSSTMSLNGSSFPSYNDQGLEIVSGWNSASDLFPRPSASFLVPVLVEFYRTAELHLAKWRTATEKASPVLEGSPVQSFSMGRLHASCAVACLPEIAQKILASLQTSALSEFYKSLKKTSPSAMAKQASELIAEGIKIPICGLDLNLRRDFDYDFSWFDKLKIEAAKELRILGRHVAKEDTASDPQPDIIAKVKGKTGPLAIVLDEDNRRIIRENAIAEFKGQIIPWELTKRLIQNYPNNVAAKVLGSRVPCSGDKAADVMGNGLEQHITTIRRILRPLTLSVESTRSVGYKLIEIPATPEKSKIKPHNGRDKSAKRR